MLGGQASVSGSGETGLEKVKLVVKSIRRGGWYHFEINQQQLL